MSIGYCEDCDSTFGHKSYCPRWTNSPKVTLADRWRNAAVYVAPDGRRFPAVPDTMADETADALDALTARNKELEEALRECADDLEGEIDGRYKGTLNYPSQLRRYERDMETVNRAREALKP